MFKLNLFKTFHSFEHLRIILFIGKEGRITHRVKLALVTGDETINEKEYDKSLFDFVLLKPIA